VHAALDVLCKDLWGLTEKELNSVEFGYRELYVSAPDDATAEPSDAES